MTHGPRLKIERLAYIPLPDPSISTAFWTVTPCSLTQIYKLFRIYCYLILRDVNLSVSPSVLNINIETDTPKRQ
jgi:hypothetical protein